jgi:putative ABC transport system permease protein
MSGSGYELQLALRNVIRHWRGIGVTVVTLAVGIAAAMTLVTVLALLQGNDAPDNGRYLYRVQMDTRLTLDEKAPGTPMADLSYVDAVRIGQEGPAAATVLMAVGYPDTRDQAGDETTVPARYTTRAFFALFQPPMAFGGPWGAAEDEQAVPAAVISDDLNHRLFAGRNSVGEHLSLNGVQFQIVGVLKKWRPTPRYYDLSSGSFSSVEEVFLPLSAARSLKMQPSSISCYFSDENQSFDLDRAECSWVQVWVRLPGSGDAQRYEQYLNRYAAEHGRIRRPGLKAYALVNEPQWLRQQKSIPEGLDVFTVIAFGFLILCTINAATYLMSNFSARSREISIRRALGGTRTSLYCQLLFETVIVGVAGGVLGILLLQVCIAGLKHSPASFGHALHLDFSILLLSLALALASSVMAGLLPAWRIGRITPARHLTCQ